MNVHVDQAWTNDGAAYVQNLRVTVEQARADGFDVSVADQNFSGSVEARGGVDDPALQ